MSAQPFDLDRRSAALLGIDPLGTGGVMGKVAVDQLGAVATGGARVALFVLLCDPDNPSPTVVSSVLFTIVFNISGLPAISLPLHQSATSGLTIGVQLVERPFNEAGLLRQASQLEAAAPWSARHPAF